MQHHHQEPELRNNTPLLEEAAQELSGRQTPGSPLSLPTPAGLRSPRTTLPQARPLAKTEVAKKIHPETSLP